MRSIDSTKRNKLASGSLKSLKKRSGNTVSRADSGEAERRMKVMKKKGGAAVVAHADDEAGNT